MQLPSPSSPPGAHHISSAQACVLSEILTDLEQRLNAAHDEATSIELLNAIRAWLFPASRVAEPSSGHHGGGPEEQGSASGAGASELCGGPYTAKNRDMIAECWEHIVSRFHAILYENVALRIPAPRSVRAQQAIDAWLVPANPVEAATNCNEPERGGIASFSATILSLTAFLGASSPSLADDGASLAVTEFAQDILKKLILKSTVAALLLDLSSDESLARETLRAMVSIPDRLGNALKGDVQPFFQRSQFARRLATDLSDGLVALDQKRLLLKQHKSRAALLMEQLVRQGHTESIVDTLAGISDRRIKHRQPAFPKPWLGVIKLLPDYILETVLLHLLAAMGSNSSDWDSDRIEQALDGLCSPLNPAIIRALSSTRVMALPLSARIGAISLFANSSLNQPNLINVPLPAAVSDSWRGSILLVQLFTQWLQQWSAAPFASNSPTEMVNNLTEMLLVCCGWINASAPVLQDGGMVEESQGPGAGSPPLAAMSVTLNDFLYSGVARYLDHPPEVRVYGQVLAEEVTRLLFPSGVDFQLDSEDLVVRQLRELTTLARKRLARGHQHAMDQADNATDAAAAPEDQKQVQSVDAPRPTKPAAPRLHPALMDDSDDSDDDEGAAEPHVDVHDRSDKARPPLFLRDCLDVLREHGGPTTGGLAGGKERNAELFMATVDALPNIIGATPEFEIQALAPELVPQLLLSCHCPFDDEDADAAAGAQEALKAQGPTPEGAAVKAAAESTGARFERQQINALTALTMRASIPASEALLRVVNDGKKATLSKRMEALQIVSIACQQLAFGKDQRAQANSVVSGLPGFADSADSASAHGKGRAAGTVVRRLTPYKAPTTRANALVGVANYFLYPLVAITSPDSDNRLMEQRLLTLATVLYCSANIPNWYTLVQDAWEWLFDQMPQMTAPELRSAALACFAAPLEAADPALVMRHLEGHIVMLQHWLEEWKHDDRTPRLVQVHRYLAYALYELHQRHQRTLFPFNG